jgi:hypothetical protein
MSEPIYFSLYQQVPDYNVHIFQKAHWVLGNGVKLEVNIIGKSHRVISRRGEDCLTEFITCLDQNLPEQAMERVCLLPAIVHDQEYRAGDLVYRVNVEHVPRVFNSMEEFIELFGEISETLTHEFMNAPGHSGDPLPFTGLVLNSGTNTFYTIHTYPERGFSIVSRTAIHLRVLSTAT